METTDYQLHETKNVPLESTNVKSKFSQNKRSYIGIGVFSIIAIIALVVTILLVTRHVNNSNSSSNTGTNAQADMTSEKLVESSSPSTKTGVKLTFYGAKDNCPPGGDIAYPTIHKEAGGLGTYKNPITYAGASAATKAGTIIYVPIYKKYFIMEDDCEECDSDWSKSKKYHFDLWMGPDNATSGKGLIECEDQLSDDGFTSSVILNPSSTEAVDTTAFFDPSRSANSGCIEPVESCTDDGNSCGNECEIPNSATCQQLANLFALTLTRFEQLNPKLNCGKEVAAGTSVCMGGTCGD